MMIERLEKGKQFRIPGLQGLFMKIKEIDLNGGCYSACPRNAVLLEDAPGLGNGHTVGDLVYIPNREIELA